MAAPSHVQLTKPETSWLQNRKVLFMGIGDLVPYRGARAYLLSLLGALDRTGAQLEALYYQLNRVSDGAFSGAPVTIINPPSYPWLRMVPAIIRRLLTMCWIMWRAAQRIRTDVDPSTVVLVTGAPILALTPLLRRYAQDIFYLMHGIAEESLLIPSIRARLRFRFMKFLERNALRHFTAVVVVSEAMARYCRSEYRVRRFVLAPCGADPRPFQDAAANRQKMRRNLGIDEKCVLLYSGSADTSHCVPEIVKAYGTARQIIPNAYLLILSHEPAAFENLLRRTGWQDWKVLSVAPDEVPVYMSAGDAAFLLLLNHQVIWVSCPVKFAEYMASGLPVVVAPYVGDYSELVRAQRVGVLLDPYDETTWKPAFMHLMSLIGKHDVRERCLEIAKSLSWDRLAVRFEGSIA